MGSSLALRHIYGKLREVEFGVKPLVYNCWRCGHTSTNPSDVHLGHKITPTYKGGNLADVNVDLEELHVTVVLEIRRYVLCRTRMLWSIVW